MKNFFKAYPAVIMLILACIYAGFSLIVGGHHQEAPQAPRINESRLDDLFSRQLALERRVDALARAYRETVRPIGWDIPHDGGAP